MILDKIVTKPHERSEKAQLIGQIWTKYACKMRGQLPSSQYFHGRTPP